MSISAILARLRAVQLLRRGASRRAFEACVTSGFCQLIRRCGLSVRFEHGTGVYSVELQNDTIVLVVVWERVREERLLVQLFETGVYWGSGGRWRAVGIDLETFVSKVGGNTSHWPSLPDWPTATDLASACACAAALAEQYWDALMARLTTLRSSGSRRPDGVSS